MGEMPLSSIQQIGDIKRKAASRSIPYPCPLSGPFPSHFPISKEACFIVPLETAPLISGDVLAGVGERGGRPTRKLGMAIRLGGFEMRCGG